MQLTQLLRNSVGRKLIMAVSGLLVTGFVVSHLLGNLALFAGQEAFNLYAAQLQQLGPLLWLFRLGLAGTLLLHVFFGIWLTLQNRAAKPTGYAINRIRSTNLAAKTMVFTGMALLLFLIGHLLHFTFRRIGLPPELTHDAGGTLDVFDMVTLSFQQGFPVLLYAGAMLALFLHLGHGLGSALQTLGACNDKFLPGVRKGGFIVALALLLGYVSIPVLTFFGFVTP